MLASTVIARQQKDCEVNELNQTVREKLEERLVMGMLVE